MWGPIPLGALDSLRDWGYAPEYVKAMQLIAENENCVDFVVATNKETCVMQFLEWCCNNLDYEVEFIGEGINEKCIDKKTGKTLAFVDKDYYRASDVVSLQGDYSKIKKELGWSPKVFANELAGIMTNYDYRNEWKSG